MFLDIEISFYAWLISSRNRFASAYDGSSTYYYVGESNTEGALIPAHCSHAPCALDAYYLALSSLSVSTGECLSICCANPGYVCYLAYIFIV